MSKKTTPVEQLTFEQAFEELEAIVRGLENESPVLEEAVALFERGQALSKHCSELLEKAELKVQQLTHQDWADRGSEGEE